MKKNLKVLVLSIVLIMQTAPVFADTTPQSSTNNLTQSTSQSTANSTSDSTSQSTTSTTQSSSQANNQTVNNNQTTPTSTTTQQPTQTIKSAPDAQNPPQSSAPASSTTIIKETVNNNNNSKNSTNIWLIILSSLSALVTIIGGLIAVIRHFRGRLTKNKLSEHIVKPQETMKTHTQETKSLSETQQMNQLADKILKENKRKTNFRRSRR